MWRRRQDRREGRWGKGKQNEGEVGRWGGEVGGGER